MIYLISTILHIGKNLYVQILKNAIYGHYMKIE